VDECRRMGVEVLRPDVNTSESGFTVERLAPLAIVDADGAAPADAANATDATDATGAAEPRWGVRFGLVAIKNVGTRPIEELLEARRKDGPFTSLADIFARTDSKNLTRGAVECLIKAGACDSLGRRSQLLAGLDRALAFGQQQRKAREVGQGSLFDMFGSTDTASANGFTLPDVPDHPKQQLLAWEKELLNLYLSAHPLAHVANILKKRVTTYTAHLSEEWAGQKVTLGGRVTEIRRIMTKKDGRTMLAVQLEDLLGGIEVVVFPRTYDATADLWREDAVLLVTGNVKMRDDEAQLVCESVETFVATDEEVNRRHYLVRIRLQRTKNAIVDTTRVHDIVTALHDFPGDDPYELIVRNGHWETRLPLTAGRQGVRFCPELQRQLEGILGPGSVEAIPVNPAA